MVMSMVVHGGAGIISSQLELPARDGCRTAIMLGWQILQHGGSALDAVEAAVCSLEDHPVFNAGTGSCLTKEGNVEMDAGIMDGSTLQVGAVAGLELIKNPIRLARKVLESQHVLLLGRGAQQFALEQGMSLCTLADLITKQQYHRWLHANGIPKQQEPAVDKKHGTVGAVAIDSAGHLAAATSTGGITNKYPGRVGDSPLVGCGFYADEHAAISCTGYGEDFTRLLIARRAAEDVAYGDTAQSAANKAIAFLATSPTGAGGLIIVNAQGQIGLSKNTRNMAYALISSEMTEPEVGL